MLGLGSTGSKGLSSHCYLGLYSGSTSFLPVSVNPLTYTGSARCVCVCVCVQIQFNSLACVCADSILTMVEMVSNNALV